MQDSTNFYLVMDHCEKGDLLEYQKLLPAKRFSENQAVHYLASIRNAFLCLKLHHIMHRDVKLENLFLDHQNTMKLGDFGFAKEGTDESFTKLGSHNTMAPEIFLNVYNETAKYNGKCDLWSIGVVYYIMLFGKKPYFQDIHRSEMGDIKKMMTSLKKFNVSKLRLTGVSPESKDILQKLLVKPPRNRMSQIYYFPIFSMCLSWNIAYS